MTLSGERSDASARVRVDSDVLDGAIERELRAAGLTWDAVALEMASRDAIRYWNADGASAPASCDRPGQRAAAGRSIADRPARPAGHPVSWGLIDRQGTVLEGQAVPLSCFSYKEHIMNIR